MADISENAQELSAAACRWLCKPGDLGFADTSELTPRQHILGQDDAVEALRFGLQSRSRGNHVFVRGLSGFGRTSLIHEIIRETAVQTISVPDRCYVHNFVNPQQPSLISLPAGMGHQFRDAMDGFAEFATTELFEFLSSDFLKSKQKQLDMMAQDRIKQISSPFDAELRDAGLAMVPVQVGQNVIPMILPLIDGKPTQFEELQQQRLNGVLSEQDFAAMQQKIEEYQKKFVELGASLSKVQIEHSQAIHKLIVEEAKAYVAVRIHEIERRFKQAAVSSFLEAVIDDLINHRVTAGELPQDFARIYRVNLVNSHGQGDASPVISLQNPTLANLVGNVDRELGANGMVVRSDHMMIKPGALLEADGGFLLLEVQDILLEPGSWAALLRTLKTGLFELNNLDPFGLWAAPQLKPEAIPINIKVVLVGDPETYYLLDAYESRFSDLFKVLADFSDTIERDASGFAAYANVVARVVERDDVLPFAAEGLAKLIEHGARICGQQGQLTSRFGRVADICREASFIAQRNASERVGADHVRSAISASKRRADIPARRFRRLVAEGTIRIAVTGAEVGQINGLAVTSAGPLVFGFPTRITASIGPGPGGVINIERESDLSGSVHTKGFLILSGLLRYLLKLDHPMAFSAAIAFEQSYGGIDGDSASIAEFCCLLSALTNLPIRQNLAVTGAVDQKGNVLPIGAVNEKIEGFFDACQSVSPEATQGVIIPAINSAELMLREDVVDAVREGQFHVYTMDRIEQAILLLLGRPAGQWEVAADDYEAGSVLQLARQKAHRYWESARPRTV